MVYFDDEMADSGIGFSAAGWNSIAMLLTVRRPSAATILGSGGKVTRSAAQSGSMV